MAAALCQGRIVWVDMVDPQGRNPKRRPAVIVTPTEAIVADGFVAVAAVTSALDQAPADVTIELPWHRDGHPRTKLRKRSVVICNWLEPVAVAEIRGSEGLVPEDRLALILAQVEALHILPPLPKPSDPPETTET